MKVSPGMADAGVVAMARLKRGSTGDTALVVGIYNAMEMCREQELKKASNLPQAPYVHQEWPKWVDGVICNGPEDVPTKDAASLPASMLPPDVTMPTKRKYTRRNQASA